MKRFSDSQFRSLQPNRQISSNTENQKLKTNSSSFRLH
jgi:hypothetical protein